jgi:hypothetical protein
MHRSFIEVSLRAAPSYAWQQRTLPDAGIYGGEVLWRAPLPTPMLFQFLFLKKGPRCPLLAQSGHSEMLYVTLSERLNALS